MSTEEETKKEEKKELTRIFFPHKNAKPGEIYLGDFCQELIDINRWKTKRVGEKIKEKTPSGKDQFEVFISQKEMESAGYVFIEQPNA